ncbi:MAG: hypothetical protein QW291_03130 [Thermofilaceae archaeon]
MSKVLLASIASRKALPLSSSLRNHGFSVYGVAHSIHPNVFSKFFEKKTVVKNPRSGLPWANTIAKIAKEWEADLVIPVDFIDVLTFAKWKNLFEKTEVTLVAPRFESIELASNKEKLPDLLRELGKTPKQITVARSNDIAKLVDLEPPLVVKGLGDAAKPEYFPTMELATRRATERAPCLVQEYIPGIGRGYYAVAFNGESILEFTHERITEYDPAGGASLSAKGPVLDPRLFKLGRGIVKLLKWSGPIMVETRFVADTGEYFVVELNPKFWGSLDLPVSLGYHFPAILAKAYMEGVESAKKAAAGLRVRNGKYYWVLDGIRYLAKIPSVWGHMLTGVAHRGYCDVDLSDTVRVTAQFIWALKRLQREKKSWISSIVSDINKLRWWAHSAMRAGVREIVFDLDGTLVSLPVDWRTVRAILQKKNLAKPWEGVTEALRRLWITDKEKYEVASSVVEENELKAIKAAKPLVKPSVFNNLPLEIKVATLQTSRSAKEILRKTGFTKLCEHIIGRDDDVGPYKEAMFLNICKEGAIVVEDNLRNAVCAKRSGRLPVLVTNNVYAQVKALRLGFPAIQHTDLPHLLTLLSSYKR